MIPKSVKCIHSAAKPKQLQKGFGARGSEYVIREFPKIGDPNIVP